jgi:hypothetical protein
MIEVLQLHVVIVHVFQHRQDRQNSGDDASGRPGIGRG